MKKTILTLIVGLSMLTFGYSQLNLGAGGQLISDGTIFGVQGKALYGVNESFDAAGTFTYHLESGVDWTIDLDAHYKLLTISDNFNIAPLAGLSITSTVVSTEVGLNLGAMFDFTMGEKERHIYVEPKIVVGGVKSFVIAAGLLL